MTTPDRRDTAPGMGDPTRSDDIDSPGLRSDRAGSGAATDTGDGGPRARRRRAVTRRRSRRTRIPGAAARSAASSAARAVATDPAVRRALAPSAAPTARTSRSRADPARRLSGSGPRTAKATRVPTDDRRPHSAA